MSKKKTNGSLPPEDLDGDGGSHEHDTVAGGDNGMPSFIDAGVGDEMASAESDTKKAILHLADRRMKSDELGNEIRQNEPDLIKRARSLAGAGLISFPENKQVRMGDQFINQAVNTDTNRYAAFAAIFGDGEDRPHIDTFRGRLVDHRGVIVDDRYQMIDMIHALAAAGLKTQSTAEIRRAFKEWGLKVQSNDLIKRVEKIIPEWDGIPRAESKLINLFGCFNTELNRLFGKYFWMSIYCRVMNPGWMAPIALSLFGAQNAGKSYFSKLICETIIGDSDADSVLLDLAGDHIDFLREITGNSIIANVGEMTGFTTADMNKIKSFMTLTSDNMHYKYEGNFKQLRQWVVVMDGNKYEGLQRDATGNRRFYPMFVGQKPDENGQPAWKEEYKADFTGFAEDVWAIMAECAAWLDANGGKAGYEKFVDEVSARVRNFNSSEMNANRGTPRDQALDNHLVEALLTCERKIINKRINKGMWVSSGKVSVRIKEISRGVNVMDNRLKIRMTALGARECQIDNTKGYIFDDIMDDEVFTDMILGKDKPGAEEDVAPEITINKKDEAGGF
jgi:hypothetical protein